MVRRGSKLKKKLIAIGVFLRSAVKPLKLDLGLPDVGQHFSSSPNVWQAVPARVMVRSRVTHVAQDLGVMLSFKKNRRTVKLEGKEIGENI